MFKKFKQFGVNDWIKKLLSVNIQYWEELIILLFNKSLLIEKFFTISAI